MQRNDLENIVRRLWIEFDPIGVIPLGAPDDEYDSYVPHTVDLLLQGADTFKLDNYIAHCVRVNMGMSAYPQDGISGFVDKLRTIDLKR